MSVTVNAAEKTPGEKAQVYTVGGKRKRSRRKAAQPTTTPEPQVDLQSTANPAERFVAKEGEMQVVPPETPAEPAAEQTTEQPKVAEEIVEVRLEQCHLVQYVECVVGGKKRFLNLSKAESFDEKTGVVRVRMSQATAWKLA